MIYVLTKEKLSLDRKELSKYNIEYTDSIDFIKDYLMKCDLLGLDSETTGLDFVSCKTVMVQIGDLDNQFIIDTRYYSYDFLKPVLSSKNVTKVLHNAKFDYKFFKKEQRIELQNVVDTFLQEKILNCGTIISASLEACAERYLDLYLDKDVRMTFLNHVGPFTLDQIGYGALDVTAPIQIMQKQQKLLKKTNLDKTAQLENEATLAFADVEFNGMKVNHKKWLALADKSREKLLELKEELNNALKLDPIYKKFELPGVQVDMFAQEDEINFMDVNWDSPKVVLEIFQETHPTLESVGKDVLSALPDKSPLMDSYIAYKKQSKLYSSYGPSFLDLERKDGLIHTNFTQILNTGRVSSSEPNMQQIPASNEFRNCFESPEEGWVYVSSDFSSQELCVIATIAKDPVWLQALEEGKDLHSVCADLVFKDIWKKSASEGCDYFALDSFGEPKQQKCNCPGHKSLRDGVKAINFGLAYGMSEYALSDRMRISVEQARDLIEEYFDTFPKIRAALHRFGEFGKRFGYIMTMPPFKRRRYFPSFKHIRTDPSVSGKIERASKNTPIQGSSADMTKYAMILVRNYIRENSLPVKMVMVVHDQIDTVCSPEYADTWTEKLTMLMEKAAKKVITNGLLKAETDQSPVWKK